MSGARRSLFDLKIPIELENPRRGREVFNPEAIKSVHLISVLMKNGEEPFPFIDVFKKRMIHVFTRDFADIALSELDTVSDFCGYLQRKEEIDRQKAILVLGGEENLLAKYLENLHGFSWMNNYDHIVIAEDVWSAFSKLPQYRAKEEADRISYGWDAMIDRAHDGASAQYERIARELARSDRFQRRILSRSFYEAYREFREAGHHVMRRLTKLEATTYCFLFMEDGKEERQARKAMLSLMCYVARGLYPENRKVIGVATEAANCSYDFCLRIQSEWAPQDEANKKKIQAETGIFVNPRLSQDDEHEYPAF